MCQKVGMGLCTVLILAAVAMSIIGAISTSADFITTEFSELQTQINTQIDDTESALKFLEEQEGTLETIEEINQSIKDAEQNVEENNQSIKDAQQAIKDAQQTMEENEQIIEDYRNENDPFYDGLADRYEGINENAKGRIETWEGIIETEKGNIDGWEGVIDTFEETKDIEKGNLELRHTQNSDLTALDGAELEDLDSLKEVREAQDSLNTNKTTLEADLVEAENEMKALGEFTHFDLWDMKVEGDLALGDDAAAFKTWFIISAILGSLSFAWLSVCVYAKCLSCKHKRSNDYGALDSHSSASGGDDKSNDDEEGAANVPEAPPKAATRATLKNENIQVVARRRLEAPPALDTPGLTLWQASPILVVVPLLTTFLAHRCIRMYRARKPVVRIPARRPSDVLLGVP